MVVPSGWRRSISADAGRADRRSDTSNGALRQNRWVTDSPSSPLTAQTVELLQQMIRNRCVNDGTAESGEEVRNADLLTAFLEGRGLDVQHYDAAPGRRSVVARIEGHRSGRAEPVSDGPYRRGAGECIGLDA